MRWIVLFNATTKTYEVVAATSTTNMLGKQSVVTLTDHRVYTGIPVYATQREAAQVLRSLICDELAKVDQLLAALAA